MASPTTRLISACAAGPPSPEYPAVPFPANVLMVWPDAMAAASIGNKSLPCIRPVYTGLLPLETRSRKPSRAAPRAGAQRHGLCLMERVYRQSRLVSDDLQLAGCAT